MHPNAQKKLRTRSALSQNNEILFKNYNYYQITFLIFARFVLFIVNKYLFQIISTSVDKLNKPSLYVQAF